MKKIYYDVCKLAVLSGMEIDKAKEIDRIQKEILALAQKEERPTI